MKFACKSTKKERKRKLFSFSFSLSYDFLFLHPQHTTPFHPYSPPLSPIAPSVATNSGINPRNICLPPKTAVPLHSQKLINSINIKIKNLKIMTQQNFMGARALSMEELENVNGGRRRSTDSSYSKTNSRRRKKSRQHRLYGFH